MVINGGRIEYKDIEDENEDEGNNNNTQFEPFKGQGFSLKS